MFQITQPLHRAALIWPEQSAVVSSRVVLTWEEMSFEVAKFAGFLRSLGLKSGDRVAMLALNSDLYLKYYMAAPWAGLIMVTLNTRWSKDELLDALNDCGAKVLLVDNNFADLGENLGLEATSVKKLVNVDSAEFITSFADADAINDVRRGNDEPVALFYTGGTTGRSKGVILTSTSLLTTGLQVQKHSGFNHDSVVLHVAPFFHMAAGGIIYASLLAGAGSVVLPAFDPTDVAMAVETHGVTHILLVPTMIEMLLHNPAFDSYNFGSLRRIVYGSSPMPETLLTLAIEKLPGVEFTQFYGMTELSPVATVLPPSDHVTTGMNTHRLRSAGYPIELCDLCIVDEHDQPVGVGIVGEVTVGGPAVMKGYWNNIDATNAAIRNGYMYTGDAGYLDKDGYLFLVDRIKDMIITGGENVYSTEVERVIYQISGVQECAVVGQRDDTWGENVCAVVFLVPGEKVTESDVIQYCNEKIAGYKCPRKVIFSLDPLPKTAAGKIAKAEIRKWFQ